MERLSKKEYKKRSREIIEDYVAKKITSHEAIALRRKLYAEYRGVDIGKRDGRI